MTINYDLKLSPVFSGELKYVKYDRLNDVDLYYYLRFHNGNLTGVRLHYEVDGENIYKDLDVEKWNGKFWCKAPEYANFDDCSWTRKGITFEFGQNFMFSLCGSEWGTLNV